MSEDTVTLYRPTGPKELALVAESGFKRWPPRLPDQPIFYPVTNEAYAAEIAQKWNVRDSGYGAVTRFKVRTSFMRRFEVQQVGGKQHTEWWVPAEQLEEHRAAPLALVQRSAQSRHFKTGLNDRLQG